LRTWFNCHPEHSEGSAFSSASFTSSISWFFPPCFPAFLLPCLLPHFPGR
jgi:hypothetical protein